jgi:hypothetical protein
MTERELEQRLRAWYRSQTEAGDRAPASLRASLTAAVEAHPRSGLFGGRSLALLAAAALLTALLAGIAAICSGFIRPATSLPSRPALVPASPLFVPTNPTTQATATASSSASGIWSHLPYQPSMKATVGSVAWTGSRFVAVSGGAGVSTFLTSVDGQTWQEGSPALRGLLTHVGDVYLWGMASGPTGIAAVGLTVVKLGAPPVNAGIAWFSTDGLDWTTVADPSFRPTIAGDSIVLRAVAPAADGWVAVGEDDGPCKSEGCGLEITRAAVWSSPDALHWTRAPAAAALDTAFMSGVAHGGQGFVAIGSAADKSRPASGPGETPTRTAIWTSRDGVNWTRVAQAGIPQQISESGLEAVAAGPGSFVAIGSKSAGDGIAAVWSTDGSTWTPSAGDFSGAASTSIAATPGGYLLVGSPPGPPSPFLRSSPTPAPTPACPSLIWSSVDGRVFTCAAGAPSDDSFVRLAIAASPSLEVLVGEDASGGSVWVRRLP